MDVTFEVDNEGILKVTAKETSTGREVAATLLTHDTPEDVRSKMRQEGSTAPLPMQTFPPPEVAAEASKNAGFFGWFKRLFAPRA